MVQKTERDDCKKKLADAQTKNARLEAELKQAHEEIVREKQAANYGGPTLRRRRCECEKNLEEPKKKIAKLEDENTKLHQQLSRISSQFNPDNPTNADVNLICSDGKKVLAHRNLLVDRSPKFKAAFAHSTEIPLEYHINDFNSITVQVAMDWMYKKSTNVSSKGLLDFACKYHFEGRSVCTFKSYISLCNCF